MIWPSRVHMQSQDTKRTFSENVQMLKGHTLGFTQMQQAAKEQKQNVNKPAEPL